MSQKLFYYPITATFKDHMAWAPNTPGIDFGTPNNSPIIPLKTGKVIFIGEDPNSINPVDGSKAKYIVLQENPRDQRYYVHLSKITPVLGQTLDPDKGDIVGFSGSTGNVTGPHTHVMKKQDGQYIDFMDEINTLKQLDMQVAGHEPPQLEVILKKDSDAQIAKLQAQINNHGLSPDDIKTLKNIIGKLI